MATTFYGHWRQVHEDTWHWKNFSLAEIACRGTGKLLVNDATLDRLQARRDVLARPLIVRSAYRSVIWSSACLRANPYDRSRCRWRELSQLDTGR